MSDVVFFLNGVDSDAVFCHARPGCEYFLAFEYGPADIKAQLGWRL